MPKYHEQTLIRNFERLIRDDNIYGVNENECHKNFNCKAKKYADVEYITKTGIRLVIEAKTHLSPDRHNSLHKIFGELLKEANRDRDKQVECQYGLLVPLTTSNRISGEEFYRNKLVEHVGMKNLKEFSRIIPMTWVFACDNKRLKMYTWGDFFEDKNCCWEWSVP